MNDSEDTWVLLTGGTGALGRHFIRGFLSKGWKVAFTCRSQQSAYSLLDVELDMDSLVPIYCDLVGDSYKDELVSQLAERNIFPTALVNGARDIRALVYDAQGLMPRENWLVNFTLEIIVPYELAMLLAKLPKTKIQSVVNIGSMYGVVAPSLDIYDAPLDSPVNYGPAKAGLIHLTKELAVRLAGQGIRVNAVSFGGLAGRVSDEFQQRYARHCPMGRMLQPEDIFRPVFFMASNDSSGVTGQNLLVDGGWTAW